MPTFYAQNTTAQLSVADLGRATTPNPRTQQSHAATESIQKIAQEFSRASKDGTLTETPLCTEDGSHVRFLGKHGDMPFFMIHAGKNFFDSTTKEKRNRRPARMPFTGSIGGESASTAVNVDGEKPSIWPSKDGKTPQSSRYKASSYFAGLSPALTLPGSHQPSTEPDGKTPQSSYKAQSYSAGLSPASREPNPKYRAPLVPHALCLTVFLSNLSFIRTKSMATARTELSDVKIDVYFNGEFCGSHFVPRRYSGEAYAMTEHIVRLTGRRIGRLVEKPWVIVPSGQTPDGSLREYRRGKVAYAGAQQRWKDISSMLMAEADKVGRDERGARPVIGEYLESLAQISLPKEVESMQKAGGPKFGVLDVVVFWGKGSKNGPDAPYITEPTSIINEGCTSFGLGQSIDQLSSRNVTNTSDSTGKVPQSRSEALANAKSIDDYSDLSSLSSTTSFIPATKDKTDSIPPNKRPISTLLFETPVKRSRGHYYDILTTKKTLSEEIDSIAEAAVLDLRTAYNPTFLTNPRTSRANNTSTIDSSPLSSAPTTRHHTPAQTKIVKLKLPCRTTPASSPGMVETPQMRDEGLRSEFLTPFKRPIPVRDSKRKERAPVQPSVDALDRGFLTPALSTDCSTTYAPSGIVRNVGAVRGGVFKEGGVVMGARFIVGG